MKFGICTTLAHAPAVAAAGWDYVEESARDLLVPTSARWTAPPPGPLPVPAANLLLPASMKVTGHAADLSALSDYMTRLTDRAAAMGITTLVFGSGKSREVPDGFDRDTARRQIVDFGRVAADAAARHGIDVVLEPLNRGECNIVNSIVEAMPVVDDVARPNFWCLLDTYHFWLEREPLEVLEAAMPMIRHVHLADVEGRVAPGLSGKNDYRPVLSLLKSAGYDRTLSFEGNPMPDFDADAPKVLAYLRREWDAA